jgi:pyrroline-5-carboxylate reductase
MTVKKLALIGAGHMGGALAAGWLRRARGGVAPDNLVLVDPRPGEAIQALIEEHGLTCLPRLDEDSAAEIDLVLLAIKPQLLEEVAKQTAPFLSEEAGLISILAGPSLADLAQHFGERPMVRAMPNTPSAIGKGISVLVANDTGDKIAKTAERLLKPAGEVEWIDDERLMGAVTGVSGSGPAYVFLLAEALAGAAMAEGIPEDLAQKLARETVIGAGALLAADRETDPQALRRAVTSPGGTTQAALDVLMGPNGGGLPELMRRAVNAAERRSRQLGQGGR